MVIGLKDSLGTTIGGPQVGYIYEDAFRELYAEKSVEAEADPAEAAPEGAAQSCIRAGCRLYFYRSMVKPCQTKYCI